MKKSHNLKKAAIDDLEIELKRAKVKNVKYVFKAIGYSSIPFAASIAAQHIPGLNDLWARVIGVGTVVIGLEVLENRTREAYKFIKENSKRIKDYRERIVAARNTDSIREYLQATNVESKYIDSVIEEMKSEGYCDYLESFSKYIPLENRFNDLESKAKENPATIIPTI